MKLITNMKMATSLLLIALLGGCGGDEIEGLYTATTADGLDIKMKRYRPAARDAYNNSTPVLLFPGITLNFNQFDVHTPDGERRYNFEVPHSAPALVRNDRTVRQDPMKYFSLAHYLYLRGYDVWLANYRGVGRGDFQSDRGLRNSNLDVWCALDFPAAVNKVRSVTGKKPVIGGHSTGGLCAYLYLQGYTMDASEVYDDDLVLPHAYSNPILAASRNSNIAGFLGLDPAGTPILAFEGLLDNPLIWGILGLDIYVDLDTALPQIIPLLPNGIVSGTIDSLFDLVGGFADATPDWFPQWADVFGALDFWSTEDMNKYVEHFHAVEGFSSFYLGGFSQYADWGINGVFREHWQNGAGNRLLINPPEPAAGDGYTYFDDNMYLMAVPAFSVFSDSSGLVDTDTMIDILYEGKTFHPQDDWIEVPNSGHIDVVNGDSAPVIAFPAIADWLDAL
ncbi:MAG: lysophospholipase [Pseudomonadales bacterium]|nr:lysophospholipase [Pseudomonadales bacterium]